MYSVGSSAQSSFDKLNNIIKSADSIRQELPVERIYVQFNKQYFSNVDTIWFKTYLFNQAFMKASEKSGILYLELSNGNNKILKRAMLLTKDGFGWGQFSLTDLNLTAGSYTIRFYTNWMRNFPQDLTYKKNIYMYNLTSDFVANSGRTIKENVVSERVEEDEVLQKSTFREIDLQFMPEGGYMVSELKSKIAFKALDERGMGLLVQGKIYNMQNVAVANFKSQNNGMGSFDFIPQSMQRYTAKLDLPIGTSASYKMPEVRSSGTILKVTNDFNLDSIYVELMPSSNFLSKKGPFYIIGHSRGVVCFGAVITAENNPKKFVIPRSAFPTGIVRITVLDPEKNIVNERMIFTDHRDNLNISLISSVSSFKTGDSISLEIYVKTEYGNPVKSSLSVSVTDDARLANPPNHNNNILSTLLLTSELRGFVEEPEDYLKTDSITWIQR